MQSFMALIRLAWNLHKITACLNLNLLLLTQGLHVVTVTSIAGPSWSPQLIAEIATVTRPPTFSPVHWQGSSEEQRAGQSMSDLDKLSAISSRPYA